MLARWHLSAYQITTKIYFIQYYNLFLVRVSFNGANNVVTPVKEGYGVAPFFVFALHGLYFVYDLVHALVV